MYGFIFIYITSEASFFPPLTTPVHLISAPAKEAKHMAPHLFATDVIKAFIQLPE
jgi:hypothetical protein